MIPIIRLHYTTLLLLDVASLRTHVICWQDATGASIMSVRQKKVCALALEEVGFLWLASIKFVRETIEVPTHDEGKTFITLVLHEINLKARLHENVGKFMVMTNIFS